VNLLLKDIRAIEKISHYSSSPRVSTIVFELLISRTGGNTRGYSQPEPHTEGARNTPVERHFGFFLPFGHYMFIRGRIRLRLLLSTSQTGS